MDEHARLIGNVLDPDRLCIIDTATKTEALQTMIAVLDTSPSIEDREALAQAVFKREDLMSTGIGLGLAVPHVRLPSVREIVMAVGIAPAGIADYVSLDDKPVHVVFLIAAPEGAHVQHLRLLSAISSRAKALKDRLLVCTDPGTVYRLLTEPEEADGADVNRET